MVMWFIFVVLIVFVVYLIFFYNMLVKKCQMVEEGWSGIDVQLKWCLNLILNFVEMVKGYVGYEQEMFDVVICLCMDVFVVGVSDIVGCVKVEGVFGQVLGCLFVVVEVYFDLKVSQNFFDLYQLFDEIENVI